MSSRKSTILTKSKPNEKTFTSLLRLEFNFRPNLIFSESRSSQVFLEEGSHDTGEPRRGPGRTDVLNERGRTAKSCLLRNKTWDKNIRRVTWTFNLQRNEGPGRTRTLCLNLKKKRREVSRFSVGVVNGKEHNQEPWVGPGCQSGGLFSSDWSKRIRKGVI